MLGWRLEAIRGLPWLQAVQICTVTRHTEIARLVALARDMLDGDDEQIVADYLSHALRALNRMRESAPAERR